MTSNRVTMRVLSAPLLPQHLVAALQPVAGMGFGADETQSFGSGYHAVAMLACADEIARDAGFAQAIKGRFYEPIQRPIAKLDARGQFMALAPSLEICDVTPKAEAILETLMSGPFVVTFRTLAPLELARRSDEDPATSRSKLSGFVEHHLGKPAALFWERPDVLGNLLRARADA